jgi:hypothetical protein
MIDEYYIVEWELPVITGASSGFGTPTTTPDGAGGTLGTKTYRFTDSPRILEDGIYKCITNVNETPVELKGGTGLASRATISISFTDFVNEDPNADSPALSTNPNIRKNSTFFNKLNQRNYLTNKTLRLIKIGVNPLTGAEVYRKTDSYLSQSFKRSSNGSWSLVAQDAMYKADASKNQYPQPITGRLTTALTDTDTSLVIDGDISDWSGGNYAAVVGDEIMKITNATGSSTQVTLTVARGNITLGTANQRTIKVTPQAHDDDSEVFRGIVFDGVQIADILTGVFDSIGLDNTLYNYTEINNELTTWISSPEVSTIYYESDDADKVLNDICSTYLIDVWFDVESTVSYPSGQVKVKSTSPWNETVKSLTEGVDYADKSLVINQPEKKQFSRCFLQYNKANLTANNDDVNFLTSSLFKNSEVEQDKFAGEVTLKRLAKSIILANSPVDLQVADLTASRFVRRFSQKPSVYTFPVDYEALDGIQLGDVIDVLSDAIIEDDGSPKQTNRAQVINIKPVRDSKAGISYKIKALTYDPFAGATGNVIPVNATENVNLFNQANGPAVADDFVFIFDGNLMSEGGLGQTITTGLWPSGSVLHVVLLNNADFRARGGNGGDAPGGQFATNGTGGGVVFRCESGNTITVNIYLSGSRNIEGETYNCAGKLIAPGGGGGASGITLIDGGPEFDAGDGGGGGAGRPFGVGGTGGTGSFGLSGLDGNNGLLDTGGAGGGNGGNNGLNGNNGTPNDSGSTLGGNAGSAIVITAGSTVNVYGNTAANYIQGNGNTPNFIP